MDLKTKICLLVIICCLTLVIVTLLKKKGINIPISITFIIYFIAIGILISLLGALGNSV